MKPINSLNPKYILLCFIAVLIVSCTPSKDESVPIYIIMPTPNSGTTHPTDVPTLMPGEPTVTPSVDTHLKIDHELNYYCNDDGEVTGAEVKVYPSGGIEPYIVKPEGKISANPGDNLKIEVFSGTTDGKPHDSINIIIERKVDVNRCKTVAHQQSDQTTNPIVEPPVVEPPVVEPPVTEPPIVGPSNTCMDGIDNDNDGLIDGKDKGCKNKHDTVED